MAELAYHGHVQPSEYSEEIRAHGLTWRQSVRLLREIRALRDDRQKVELEWMKAIVKAIYMSAARAR